MAYIASFSRPNCFTSGIDTFTQTLRLLEGKQTRFFQETSNLINVKGFVSRFFTMIKVCKKFIVQLAFPIRLWPPAASGEEAALEPSALLSLPDAAPSARPYPPLPQKFTPYAKGREMNVARILQFEYQSSSHERKK